MKCDFKYDDPCVHLIKGDDRDFCKRSSQFLCLDTLDNKIPVMSHSSRMSWTRCRYKYYLSNIMGIKSRDHMKGAPLKIGTVIDRFCEYRYQLKPFKEEFKRLTHDMNMSDVEIAKCYAIIKASHDLEAQLETGGKPQYEVRYETETCKVKGFIDCKFNDHADEIKTSTRPDFYRQPFNLKSQLSTYFLGNESIKYFSVKIIRVPTLRYNQDKESIDDYQDRLYSSIISRPSYYFIGWKKLARTWGIKFHRSEYDMDDIRDDYEKVSRDIVQAAKDDSFYQSFNCYCPGECEYLPICKTGGVSEEIYEYRQG